MHHNSATHCNMLQITAARCNTLQLTAKHTATHCNTLQHAATHCNTLQHTATHCNTTATHAATQCNTSKHTLFLFILLAAIALHTPSSRVAHILLTTARLGSEPSPLRRHWDGLKLQHVRHTWFIPQHYPKSGIFVLVTSSWRWGCALHALCGLTCTFDSVMYAAWWLSHVHTIPTCEEHRFWSRSCLYSNSYFLSTWGGIVDVVMNNHRIFFITCWYIFEDGWWVEGVVL